MLVNTNVTFRRRRDGEDDDDDEMSLNWPQSLSFPLSPDLVVRKRGTRGQALHNRMQCPPRPVAAATADKSDRTGERAGERGLTRMPNEDDPALLLRESKSLPRHRRPRVCLAIPVESPGRAHHLSLFGQKIGANSSNFPPKEK